MSKEQTIYQREGFENRRAYLESLADEYCLDLGQVIAMASVLGHSEDFDGLVTHCQDAMEMGDDW